MKLQFSEWLDGKTSFAAVGASADPDNPERKTYADQDRWMLNTISDYLHKHYPELDLRGLTPDFIDLNDGRDFLKENQQYDIVALMRVFHPMGGDSSVQHYQRDRGESMFRLSSLHTPENWKKRLQQTGAKIIFAFGDSTDCVEGDYVGSIPGYEGPDKNRDVSVWKRSNRALGSDRDPTELF